MEIKRTTWHITYTTPGGRKGSKTTDKPLNKVLQELRDKGYRGIVACPVEQSSPPKSSA